jgi:hypothetical protein
MPNCGRLEVHERGEAKAAALNRMEVDVVDAVRGLARQELRSAGSFAERNQTEKTAETSIALPGRVTETGFEPVTLGL